MDTFVKTYDENIRPLMNKIDEVRRLLSWSNDGIIFPNVVVVGDQSSGKSSLLESLSLVELPKGTGIITRCPLVLRLRQSSERSVYRLYGDDRKVLLDEATLNMAQYIEEETKKLAGYSKNIVRDFIELQVEDPHVRDLTVVDLPGIARNALHGQPKDIHKQTTDLIRKYITPEGSVILCVFPANVDIGTVESFSLAHEVDPLKKRTIGVITKTDLAADQDMLVQQLLMHGHDVTHLKLGFVAVRNRGTDENISLEDARNREQEFFREHPASTVVGWNCLGIDALINRLATLYSHRVKEIFPKMKNDIQARLIQVREDISKLPPDLQTPAERLAAYNGLVDLYIEKILKAQLTGSNDSRRITMVNTLHQKFIEYRNTIREQMKELYSPEYRANVQKEMLKCSGEQLPNFLCSSLLKQFISEKLVQLWNVTDKLIDGCFRTTINVITREEQNECKDNILLTRLIRVFHHVTISYMNQKKQAVYDQLKELLQLDQYDPYTINTSYMFLFEKYTGPLAENKSTQPTTVQSTMKRGDDDDELDELILRAFSTDEQALRHMLISLYAYWKSLTKRFIDYVTLSLRAACLYAVCPAIQQHLRQIPVEQTDLVDTHLVEDAFIQTRRKEFQKMKERLEKADAILRKNDKTINDDDNNDAFIDLIPMEDDLLMTSEAHSENSQSAGSNGAVDHYSTMSTIIPASSSQVDQRPWQPNISIPSTFNFTTGFSAGSHRSGSVKPKRAS